MISSKPNLISRKKCPHILISFLTSVPVSYSLESPENFFFSGFIKCEY